MHEDGPKYIILVSFIYIVIILFRSSDYLDIITGTTILGVSGRIQLRNNVIDRSTGSYYQLQNVQSLSDDTIKYMPVLVWSESHNWTVSSQANVIIWSGNSLNNPMGRASLLDITLCIGEIESPPSTILTEISGQ